MKKALSIFAIAVFNLFGLSACQVYGSDGIKASVLISRTNSGFEVSLHNPGNRKLCMHSGLWPNGKGYVGHLEGIPELRHEGIVFPYKLWISALGHSSSRLELDPGEMFSHIFQITDFENAPQEAELV